MSAKKEPEWGYRKRSDGTIEKKLFPEGRPARGWKDTPAKCK